MFLVKILCNASSLRVNDLCADEDIISEEEVDLTPEMMGVPLKED